MTDRPAPPHSAPARVAVFARLWEPGLGDLVQRNIFLALIRRAYPEAVITHVLPRATAARFGEFLAGHSLAADVLCCPDYGDDDPAGWAHFQQQAGRFDLCVVDPDSHGLGGTHAAAYGIPHRIGFALGHTGPDGLTTTIRIGRPLFGAPDLFDFATGLAQALGVPPPGHVDTVPPFPYAPEPLPDLIAPTVVLHPGGAPHWNRRWPLARYIELAERLGETAGSIAWVGSADEVSELQRAGKHVFAGVGLNRLATLLAHADLLIGSDSAPAHIAAALGTPTIVLYGPTFTEFMWARVYPRHEGINRRYPCQQIRNLQRGAGPAVMPCEHSCRYAYAGPDGPYPKCLTDITVDEVHRAARRRIPLRMPHD
uniref:Glycosyl transferase, family 9 n=1 Tax=uncultured bacterium esnapd14 TaxID=1366594 RepID=S5TMS9_9BACT|nr:glycosyl transferase, family 9 [uncultured bacterium esnapd14]